MAAGYEVKIIAGDGWSTVLDSADIAGSDAILSPTPNGSPALKTESGKDCWASPTQGFSYRGSR